MKERYEHSDSSISTLRESFISIKVCKSKAGDKRERIEAREAKREEIQKRMRLIEIMRKIKENRARVHSIDPIPYDEVLTKSDGNCHKKFSRFEAFLKLEMEDKEVVEKDFDYVIEHKDKYKGKFHYSK